jgi:hypothetical protein
MAEQARRRKKIPFVVRHDDGRRRASTAIGARRVIVGSGKGCGIRLAAGPGIADQHIALERAGDRLLLLSLADGTAHPVLVNDAAVEAAHLQGGETIALGAARLWLRIEAPLTAQAMLVRAAFARAPGLSISLLVHLALLLLLARITVTKLVRPAEPEVAEISLMRLTERPSEDALPGGGEGLDHTEEPAPALALEPEKLGAAGELESTPPATPALESELPSIGQGRGVIRPGARGTGGDGGSGGIGEGGGPGFGGGWGGGSGGFGRRVSDLRAKGLDLAIVFDSTSSMADVLAQVKRDLAAMVNAISLIVPDFRIALVTYKGLPEFGPVTLALDFTLDRYEMVNFLDTLNSDGGAPDARSAMREGVTVATSALTWRPSVERVLIVLGDAPPFRSERAMLVNDVASFAGRFSTVYKASGGQTESMLSRETVDVMKDLARGKGDFVSYDGEGPVVRRLVAAALGSAYTHEIDEVFAIDRDRSQQDIVARRVAKHDYDWLFDQFARRRVHPAVVDGLLGFKNPYVAARVCRLLQHDSPSRPYLRARCLYLLRRLVHDQAIDYDPHAAESVRARQLDAIQHAIQVAFG